MKKIKIDELSGKGLLSMEYVLVEDFIEWDDNPKRHDLPAIQQAIRDYGFQDPAKYDSALGAFIFGNGRSMALLEMQNATESVPAGIAVVTGGENQGKWAMPVIFGNDLKSREVAEAFAIDHNNLTVLPGVQTAVALARIWDAEKYSNLAAGIYGAGGSIVTIDESDSKKLVAAFSGNQIPTVEGAEAKNGDNEGKSSDKIKFLFGDFNTDFDFDFYEKFSIAVMRFGTIEDVLKFGLEERE